VVGGLADYDAPVTAQLGGGDQVGGIAEGLMSGPAARMVGDQPPITPRPHMVQVGGHLDAAADCGRVDRVVVAVQPYIMVARQPQRGCQPVAGATGGSGSIAARSALIRSAGAQPSTRRWRWLTRASQSPSWALKSAGELKLRPGRNEVSS
jgi:hypothetical protein